MRYLSLLCFLFFIISASGQTLLIDPSTGCQYTLPWNCEECTLSWTGNCQDNLPNGEGTLSVYHDATEIMKYVGSMKNGNFNGVGTYQDGMNKMKGYFNNNRFINVDSTIYEHLETHQISEVDSAKINYSFFGDNSLYYYAVSPEEKPAGALVLLPSLYEHTEQVLSTNASLVELALNNDLVVIAPTINSNFLLNKPSLDFLNEVFADASRRYPFPEKNFIIGGFSLGGLNALRYTELSYENKSTTVIQPLAVFGVDPPTDLVNLYKRQAKYLKRDSTNQEANIVINALHENLGMLDGNYHKYVQHSAYSYDEAQGGNLKYLQDVPVRIYCDPDIDWWMKNRNFSYYDINASELSAMLLQLKENGNTHAQFINALGKGYRENGNRHPHSWSLIEPKELIEWVLSLMK